MTQEAARELLLILLRRGSDPMRAERLLHATREVLQEAMRLAAMHGLTPLLYRQCSALGTPRIPAEILTGLRTSYVLSARRNQTLYHHLGGVLNRFHQADVAVIPLKGAYLAPHIYGNIADRPMADVDLLVKRSDLARARQIMVDMNFRCSTPFLATIEEGHHFIYIHQQSGHYEIHWDLVDAVEGVYVDLEGIWDRAQPALIAGIPVSAMSPEDLILHLCIHASVHIFEMGLRMICDLAATIHVHGEKIAWEQLNLRGHEWGAQRCVYVSLWLAKELLHAPVPENWLGSFQPKDADPQYLAFAREHVFMSIEAKGRALASSRTVAKYWGEKNILRKASVLWKSIFPSRQIMSTLYSAPPDSWRIALYYPLRLRDLFRRNGHVAWLLYRGDAQMRARAEHQGQVNQLRSWLLSG